MRKLNVNWTAIGDVMCKTAELAAIGLVTVAGVWCSSKAEEFSKTKVVYATGYSGAIEAIMNSDMTDYYKHLTIDMLRRDGDESYFTAVSCIVGNDSMTDYYKVESIKKMHK